MAVWLKRIGWMALALVLLGLVAWLGLPALIKWQVPPRLSEALGRNVTIGEVGFKPWKLTLTIDELAVAGRASGDAPLLKVKRVLADASLASLFRLAPVIEALEIDSPQLRVARTAEGHYDVDDLIARFTPKPDATPTEPAHFALYNLQVRDARLTFDDRPVKRVHQIEALQLGLPFLSNLPAQVDIKVEPHLAFKLNGTAFDSGAQATPFAKTKSGVLELSVADLDLVPYLGYLPSALPVRVTRGSLSAKLDLTFAVPPDGAPSVTLRGTAGAKNLALTDAAGAPLLEWQQLQLALREVQPLVHKLAFNTLRIDGLQLHATRDAAGHVNLLDLAAPKNEIAAAPRPASAASAGAPKPDGGGWQMGLDALTLADMRVLWNDAAVRPAAALQLDGLNLGAKQIRWPIEGPVALTLNGALHPQGTNAQGAGSPSAQALAEFSATGPVTDREAKLKLTFKGLSLAAFAPYLAQSLVPSVDGQLAAQMALDWAGGADAPRLMLVIDSATLDDLKLREGAGRDVQDAIALKQLALADVQLDVLARSAVLGSVKLLQPSAAVARGADGRLNLERWVASAPVPASAPVAAAADPAWRVQLKDFSLDGGQLKFSDAKISLRKQALRVEIDALRVDAQGLEWHGDHATAPGNLQFSARIGAPTRPREKPRALAGAIDYKGRIGLAPLLASGKLRVERFPVQLFAPYFADQVQLSLLSAEAGYKGDVSVRQLAAGLEVSTAGDVLLGGVHVATLPDASAPASADNTDELLSWQSLALKGVKFAMKPKARPRLEIKEAALNDFYSRLVITEQGHFNLQDVTAAPGAAASASAPTGAASTSSAPAAAASGASAPPGDATPLPIDIKVGVTKLINGRIDFSDHFVRPNYSAALTELNGQLGAFSSGSRDAATLELRGRAAGTALLEVNGQLNPTARPLALDIRAKATDLELAPLSPYAGKYAGYAIERGKLSMDVAYKIEPDGKLEARNQVILNQLTFGDKIESKDATKLPVLLAVALLKDRNGVIDINLPVSGSINDPKFSIGGIIWKVILNLLTKAITAPFALLSGGGSDDLSVVEFQPGTAQITAGGAGAIDKVAKALTERPALKMTVTGASDPVGERDAFQHAAIESRLVTEQRREGLRAGVPAEPASAASGASAAPVVLSAEEHARLLKQLYKATDIPNKPRNVIGVAKDIPAADMEALLKTRTPVTDDAMRELALQRGLAVRDVLIAKGLPSERLFVAAPKLRAAAEDAATWTPRVQLSLSTN
jgi:uncharacterized protein involved in outer membrane biogenesis